MLVCMCACVMMNLFHTHTDTPLLEFHHYFFFFNGLFASESFFKTIITSLTLCSDDFVLEKKEKSEKRIESKLLIRLKRNGRETLPNGTTKEGN